MDSKVVRAFLALPLAQAFQAEVRPLIEILKNQYPDFRWVHAGEIHLTLHFFGSISTDEVGKIANLVRPLILQRNSFQVSLAGIGAFPNSHHPRVIWLGMNDESGSLKSFQAALEDSLKRAGFPTEAREFKPHLTLARLKKDAEKKHSSFHPSDFGPTFPKRIREVILFKSDLRPDGAHYEPIETFPLSAA